VRRATGLPRADVSEIGGGTHQRNQLARRLLASLRQLGVEARQVLQVNLEGVVVHQQRRLEAVAVDELGADAEGREKGVEGGLGLGVAVWLQAGILEGDGVDAVLFEAAHCGVWCAWVFVLKRSEEVQNGLFRCCEE
jgi:hypothetical protein